jgi:hypothetical protein
VVLPHRSVAFVAGSEDGGALADLAAEGECYLRRPRFISGIPLTLGADGRWDTYLPAPGTRAERPLKSLTATSWANRYVAQRRHMWSGGGGARRRRPGRPRRARGSRGRRAWRTAMTWRT